MIVLSRTSGDRAKLRNETDDYAVLAELEAAGNVQELIAVARRHDLTIDDANSGHRDGWTLTAQTAAVYASCRSFTPGDYDWVEIEVPA